MSIPLRYTLHPGALEGPARSIDSPERLRWAVEALGRFENEHTIETRQAAMAELELAHDPVYLHGLRALSASGRETRLDPELVIDRRTFPQAQAAAGAMIAETERAMTGKAAVRVCCSRPGSHHAGTGFAMGFCVINNLAVAAHHAIAACGLERVAILDFDAHHGNGTQEIFWRDPRVLTVSMHQSPFFPGTGGADEVGAGAGRGMNLNLPLAAGRDGRVAGPLWQRGLDHLLRFEPQLVLFEAGFDGHARDWTTELNLTDVDFHGLGELTGAALAALGAPTVFELGGGYVDEAISGGLPAFIEGLGVTRSES